jgi:hypothetical protein
MAGFIGRVVSAGRIAWTVAAVLLVALVAFIITADPRLSRTSEKSYSEKSAALAGADRAEPLRMRLEGQYPGPLQDTLIQRWRDPVDGTVCYVYLPVAVAHAAGPNGLVQYGSAQIGSISCMHAAPPD